MALKFVVLFAYMVVTTASLLPAAVQANAQPILAKVEDEFDPHPQYKFAYDVEDVISGDSKTQVEEREGDVVQGEYSLNDADGYRRTAQYSADPVNGFNAIVHREPLVKTVAEAPLPKAAIPKFGAQAANIIKTPAVAYISGQDLLKSTPLAYSTAPAIPVTHH